jgi:hypothetical protein
MKEALDYERPAKRPVRILRGRKLVEIVPAEDGDPQELTRYRPVKSPGLLRIVEPSVQAPAEQPAAEALDDTNGMTA